MQPHDERTRREYKKWGQELPKHHPHGTDEEIRSKLERLFPNSWKLEGNKLIGKTKLGPLVQNIPTTHILTGTDEEGMPIFKRVDI